MATTRSYPLGSLAAGVNNRLEQSRLEVPLANRAKMQYQAAAENVDIAANGSMRRRKGMTQRQADTAPHSLWSDGQHDEGFAVVGGNLVRLTPGAAGALISTTVRAGVLGARVSFERFPDGSVYWTDGAVLRRVKDGADHSAVTPPLASNPSLTVGAGALPAGLYQFAFTVLGADGESAATPPRQVAVPENGGVTVAGLPGSNVQVYMSGPNGSVLTLQTATTAASVAVNVLDITGIPCGTLFMSEMPAGSIVRHYKGRMLVALGTLLLIGEPFYPGIFDAAAGYIPFPKPITVVQPTEGGVYVVADQTYWLAGDLQAGGPVAILPYGAVRGTGGYHERTKTAFWLSDRGLVVGDAAGAAKNVQEDALRLAGGLRGATLYREQNGATHIITVREGADPVTSLADGFAAAELLRKENEL